jgi:rubredoxin
MSLVTTMGKFCFIHCDGPDCSKKIEHIDPEQAKQLARLCGWEKIAEQWMCPACVARFEEKTPPRRRRSDLAHTANR